MNPKVMAEPETGDQPVAGGDTTGGDTTGSETTGGQQRPAWRRIAGWVTTGLAAVLVLAALLVPNQLGYLTPAAFVRIPAEGLLAVALLLLLPPRARRVAALVAGGVIGVLAVLNVLDMGFSAVLARPFDPVLDWPLLRAAMEFLGESAGQGAAVGTAVAAAVLAIAVLVLVPLALLRLTRPLVRHRPAVAGTAAALAVGWVVCAVLGVQIVPGVPVAAHHYERVAQVAASMQDRHGFAEQAAVDAFRDTPAQQLLTALRGKDVVIAFVESYGRDAIEDPEFAPHLAATLTAGEQRLAGAGFASRSGFLTAPVFGGNSWLAHATLLSGLWVDNQQRYRTLVASDRLTLTGAFRRAGWRTVAVMPAIWRAWPEGSFYGYDEVYVADDLGYQGPRMNWGIIPDQYSLSVFQQAERTGPDRQPVMVELALISSHAPWAPVPQLVDWEEIGPGGAGFEAVADPYDPHAVLAREQSQVRTDYRRAVEYTLGTLISYLETYGDEDLVLVVLGDHQAPPLVTGEDASWDVPVTIVAGDPVVADRIAGWGWEEGLLPGPQAPVWRMDEFRDQFLTAFSRSPPAGTR